jgi:transcriptional regulator with XRE-family HTH domain
MLFTTILGLFILQLWTMTKSLKRKAALSSVIIALLKARGMSQRQLAQELDTSPSNLNQRINAGSMRPEMIIQINRILKADILYLSEKVSQGASIQQIISQPAENKGEKSRTPIEYQKIIDEQHQTILELQEQVSTLISTLQKFV